MKKCPETKGCIEYCHVSEDSDAIKPRWYDNSVVLWYEKDMPIRLIWRLYFKVNAKNGTKIDESGQIYIATVDAHSGEILGLPYEGIFISKSRQYRGL